MAFPQGRLPVSAVTGSHSGPGEALSTLERTVARGLEKIPPPKNNTVRGDLWYLFPWTHSKPSGDFLQSRRLCSLPSLWNVSAERDQGCCLQLPFLGSSQFCPGRPGGIGCGMREGVAVRSWGSCPALPGRTRVHAHVCSPSGLLSGQVWLKRSKLLVQGPRRRGVRVERGTAVSSASEGRGPAAAAV